ncbi:MAG TPA: hypothetical protein PKA88_02030, partial [Polyangiaceae bacterium]|nr:hypothetical protein [Polyangiaceae bacterium]
MDLDALRARLADASALRPVGTVRAVTGLAIRVAVPSARVGDIVVIRRRGDPLFAEIVGFNGGGGGGIPLGERAGVGADDAGGTPG